MGDTRWLVSMEKEPTPAEAEATPPRRTLYLGVLLVSLGVLLLQIALTRLFSFTIWYHFAYVTISVALLGYGSAGSFLTVFPGLTQGRLGPRLSTWAFTAGLLVSVALVAVARLPFHPFQLREHPGTQLPLLVLFHLVVAAPFFMAGGCISLALKSASRQVARLYFFDLLGAGIGCLLVVWAIWRLTTPGAVAAAAAAFGAAGIAFRRQGRRSRPGTVLTALVVAGLAGVAASNLRFQPSPEKSMAWMLAMEPVFEGGEHWWTPIYRTDVVRFRDEEQSRKHSYAEWGISPDYKEEAAKTGPRIRFVAHDGDACAVIYNFDGDLSKLEMFDHHVVKTPYVASPRRQVLVIGLGGGMDVLNAVFNGVDHVTGVELDPVTIDVVRQQMADFSGGLYDRSDVTVVAGEGRSTLRHSGESYDLIQLSGVDTMAALSTGAYVLSESYLYTVEAMREFLAHLTPDGIVSVVVADHDEEHGYPRHTMRQLSLFARALAEQGVEEPSWHVAVVASTEGAPQVACLMKASPFTSDEVERLQSFAERHGFEPWALPGRELPRLHSRYLRMSAEERAGYREDSPLIIDATTDDNPFFFNFYRWRDLGRRLDEVDVGHTLATSQIVMASLLIASLVLSTTFILGPLLVFRRRGLRNRGRWGVIAFFAGIGLGFILIEISFVQKFVLFLGYPTYSLTVVLFSLLTYSGAGSLLSGRLRSEARPRLLVVTAALIGVSLLYLVGLSPLFDRLLGSPFGVRVIVASAALLPLGLLMGTFFPTGIGVVRSLDPELVPWAWAVNGCASVVGTVLAVVLAMSQGFRFVTLVALGAYGVAVLGLLGMTAAVSGGSERAGA